MGVGEVVFMVGITEGMVIAICAAVPPTIIALAGLVVSVKTGKKADTIQTTVNGNHTRMANDLAEARRTIETMRGNRRADDAPEYATE